MKTFQPDAAFVNLVINHPSVRRAVEPGQHRLDAAGFLAEPANAILACGGGVAVFVAGPRGSYDGHVFMLPGWRGAKALEFGREALDWLFGTVGAAKLIVPVSVLLPAARFYCRRLGLRPAFRDLFLEYFEMEACQWVA